jgi:hypothetical protein
METAVPSANFTHRPRQRQPGCARRHQTARLTRECHNHPQWQANAGTTVSSCADTVHAQTLRCALSRPRINGALARAIHLQRLLHEHRQCHRRWIQPLAMFRQMGLRHLQQLRPGKNVEEVHRASPPDLPTDTILMLLRAKTDITISQGWPPRLVGWMCSNDILPIPVSLPLLLQCLSSTNQYRWRLSKRHCS